MKTAKSLISLVMALAFMFTGCMQQDSMEMEQSSDAGQYSNLDPSEGVEQDTTLEISLGGASRAERFLGSYDEITRLSLDIVRNYGNKIVEEDFKLTQNAGVWEGTVPKLIVGFEYTITAHAYRVFDAATDSWTTAFDEKCEGCTGQFLELFIGEVQHTVIDGTNDLSIRLAPILDDRTLSVPRITRIQRPFQLGTDDDGEINVFVDTVGTGDNNTLSYRFRAVDTSGMPVVDGSRGEFDPASGEKDYVGGAYEAIDTDYTAPAADSVCFSDDVTGQCAQKLQVRVSNLQEIGVSAHFTVYVTDDEDAETVIDTNPVITSISAERVDSDKLQISINVSDDDLFSTLAVNWEYLFGEPTRDFNDTVEDELTDYTGLMRAVMDYADSDDGMLVVTVCETDADDYSSCGFGNEASTSIQLELIQNAYPEIVVCDDTGCELPNRVAGTMDSPKVWSNCTSSNKGDWKQTWKFTSKTFEKKREQFSSSGESCDPSSLLYTQVISGRAAQDSDSAYVYPSTSIDDSSHTGGDLDVYEVVYTVSKNEMTLHNSDNVSSFYANKTCGYNDWAVDRTMDVSGCSASGIHYSFSEGDTIDSIIYHDDDETKIRLGGGGFGTGNLDCLELGLEGTSTGSSSICSGGSHDSGSGDSSNSFSYVKRNDLNDYGYYTCEDMGYYTITSPSSCEEAVNYLNTDARGPWSLSFDGNDEGSPDYPHGCYDMYMDEGVGGSVYVNNKPDSTTDVFSFDDLGGPGLLCSDSEPGSHSSSFQVVRISNLSDSERNYFGQDGTEGDGYTTVTLTVNGASFTGTTVRTGSWALSPEWGDISYQIWDNFAYASDYGDLPWEVTHAGPDSDAINVTMKDGSSIEPTNVIMSINIGDGVGVLTEDIQGVDSD